MKKGKLIPTLALSGTLALASSCNTDYTTNSALHRAEFVDEIELSCQKANCSKERAHFHRDHTLNTYDIVLDSILSEKALSDYKENGKIKSSRNNYYDKNDNEFAKKRALSVQSGFHNKRNK